MIVTLSVICASSSRRCEIYTIPHPWLFSLRIILNSSSISRDVSADVGSSNSMTSGFIASERIIATLCFCPPESCAGYASALSRRPILVRSSSAFFDASSFVITPSFTGASMIFAFIVMLANRLNCRKTMPIFCLVTLMSVDLSVRSVPSKRICPDVGISSRLRERKNVDFPQPDGPMMAITSPLFTSVLMPFNTSCSPKLLCRSFTSSITLLSFIASQSPLKFAYSVA